LISKQEFAQEYHLAAEFILNQIYQNINERAVSVRTVYAVFSIELWSENKIININLFLNEKKSGILNSFSCALRKTQLIRLVKRILLFILSQLRKKWNLN